ncbi:MAG: threonine synthase [Alphaproteobacteria bacterium]
MRYVSTRGNSPAAGFKDVLLQGLAPDGGLYVPQAWPQIGADELKALVGCPYTDVAFRVIQPFVGSDIDQPSLKRMIAESYASFDHHLVAPLVQLGPSDWLLELFHGPTLAFKDVALQLLGRLFGHVLAEIGNQLTIVGATSGDTGSAAIEAIKGRPGMRIVILHPEGRVSDVQRRQMTTAREPNVTNIAVAGTFDDCQRILKELFADKAFASEIGLSGINSINWARIMAQAVYYVTASLALGGPARKSAFVVPTGNFGDIYAGYVAAQMGLPIDRLVIATNVNDILARTLASGRYEIKGVTPTTSPSMDIEVSSNFERLVFETTGRDAARTSALFASLRQSGSFELPQAARADIAKDFSAERASEDEVSAAIARVYRNTRKLIDPHTAVGVVAAEKARRLGALGPATPAVILATAHPAKFPDAVQAAAGVRPELPLRFRDLLTREERLERAPADASAIKSLIRSRLR